MRGSTCVGNCASGEEELCGRRRRTVQRVEAARPPFTAPVWIGSEIQQRAGVTTVYRFLESFDQREIVGRDRLDVVLEFAPAREAVFSREDVLRIGQT